MNEKEKEKDKFYWWARLATADMNIPDAECQKLADFLEKLSAEIGLPAGELWDEMRKAYVEKLEADEDNQSDEWKNYGPRRALIALANGPAPEDSAFTGFPQRAAESNSLPG